MAPNPILALVLPLLYVFVSMFVLLNFTTLLEVIGRGPSFIKQYKQLEILKPFIVNFVEFATRVFGPLSKFTPQPTHVMLIAIVVAIVMHGGRK
ncbi:MAG: hypothetical protein WDW38_002132 [Sanguina aurantia]